MPKRKISDEDLRAELKKGMSVPDIARKYGMIRQSLYARAKLLSVITTDSLVNGPTEAKRFVNTSLDVLEQLARGLSYTNKLMDAYDEWLTDAEDPSKYDVGPRSTEVVVTYTTWFDDKPVKQKATLAELLHTIEENSGMIIDRAETKTVDPRDGIIKAVAEGRKTMEAGVQMAKTLADARSMAVFRDTLLEAIRKVSPDVAREVAMAVRHATVLNSAIAGIAGLPTD